MTDQLSQALVGVLEIDGKQQAFEASTFTLRVSEAGGGARADGMGTQVTESFSISGGTLVTSVTVRSGGTTTTTTTTSDDRGTTTTTTTTDANGTSTSIKITKK
ncbi:hypothetical protein FHR83_000485 [Actinoplanes campanulatus]|uniref:Uncharacterized protein n=1 Tax=Actinoplanes campanulatus TaxID=113559 RepID=A0A7W5AAS2_9ACTN|nr:hypothetical protein [Actinoplanes campanulatus]MBB3092851.1 hypothetical protein [Actinoplanes campanulatus]GGM99442.1 hypothetical protein GCM10010109_04140 [Actinoplanes campanulatus]GID34051.1 hypothetical protein Aca09nite_05570 [Actinoplanes campanulatus]